MAGVFPSPRYAFFYNPTNPDLLSLPSSSQHQLTSIHPFPPSYAYRTGLGAHTEQQPQRSRFDGVDDHIPGGGYGPTTHRRGRMRFVPATLGVLEGTEAQGEAGSGKGKGRMEEEEDDEEIIIVEEEEKPRKGGQKLPGGTVRGLYESIVGLGSREGSSSGTEAGPSSARRQSKSPNQPLPLSTASAAAVRSPVASSSKHTLDEEEADIVLSSDDDDDEAPSSSRSDKPPRPARHRPPPPLLPSALAPDDFVPFYDSDDDCIILDSTGAPSISQYRPAPPPSSPSLSGPTPFSTHHPPPREKAAKPLSISQLLPPSSVPPPSLPTHYALDPSHVGWRLLAQSGWAPGQPLGLPSAPLPSSSSSSPSSTPASVPKGLIVPLRAIEKHDRAGLGAKGTTKAEWLARTPVERERVRREREEAEKRQRERRGKGSRGMERAKKREERERKAMVAYINHG